MSESSEQYTHGHHESVLRSHTWRTIANSAAYLEPRLRPGASLLDVGCGPGTITAEFARRLAPGRVVGLDASAEVIARAVTDATGPEYVVGDAYSLPFDDDSFDIAHAHQVLQHVGDPVAVLREMRRVVKAGGVVAVRDVDYAGTVWFPASPALTRWLEVYQQVARSSRGEPDAGRRLQSWARAAGLRDIRATASVWCFSTEDDRAWWGDLWADRVLHSAFASDALAKSFATPDELQEISDQWRRWAADDDAVLIMPHGEVLATV